MQIVAHRGQWLNTDEKNSLISTRRASQAGYGIEIDIRDKDGDIIVAHDMPVISGNYDLFEDHLREASNNVIWAINIKADGIGLKLAELLNKYNIKNYFVFDMSLPEMVSYGNLGLNVFVSVSDICPSVLQKEQISGIWLDSFERVWYGKDELNSLAALKKPICVVSEELHHRSPYDQWALLKACNCFDNNWYLCTDMPNEAEEFFNDKSYIV